MSSDAIVIEKLGKQYTIGTQLIGESLGRPELLQERIGRALRAAMRELVA